MKQGSIGVTTENIFPVIKKFLYSDHEIFLRELVANAVDATQKIKALADSGEFKGELGDLTIRIEADSEAKTLKIIDNGLGMTEEEVNKYINQIAFSSAGEFLEKYKDQLSSIIGHFGLVKESRNRHPFMERRRRGRFMDMRRQSGIRNGQRHEDCKGYDNHPAPRR